MRALIGLLSLALVLSIPSAARADEWGITRDPAPRPARPAGRPPRPRPVAGAPGHRQDVLLARYRAVLARRPTDDFAFQRLVDLYRERDGSLDRLVEALDAEARAPEATFATRLLLARAYDARGDVREAERALAALSVERPNDADVALLLASIASRRGDRAGARLALEQAIAALPNDARRRDAHRRLGELLLDAGDVDGARAHFEALAGGPSAGVYLRTELARALEARNRHAEAVEEYRAILASMRGDVRATVPLLRDLGRAELEAGRIEDALRTLDRALDVAGRSAIRAEIYDLVVDASRRAGRLDELVRRLDREGARDFHAKELLARLYDELGREEDALEAYRAALRIDPRSTDTRLRYAQLLARSGRVDDVLEEYRTLVRYSPGEPRFVLELAELLVQIGRRDEALRLAEETGRRNPRAAEVHQALAELYARLGEEARAREEIETLVRIDPHEPSHFAALGARQLEEGHRDLAIATFRRILDVVPDRGEAHATLARTFADHDLLTEAETHFRAAFAERPDDVDLVRDLAAILERPRDSESPADRRRRDEEALVLWQRTIAPSVGDASSRREGRQRVIAILGRLGQLDEMRRRWEAALAATPPDVDAGRLLAESYLGARPRDPERADAVLARVVATAPGDVESLARLEQIRTVQGNRAGAIEILQRLVTADPRRASSYLVRMAGHAHALYRDDDAVAYMTRAVDLAPDDAEAHRKLGELYRERQDAERAIASLERAIELDDRQHETRFGLAELYLAKGAPAEADRHLRAVLRETPDDELVLRAARALLPMHLGAGTLDALEGELLPLALAQPRRPVFRRLLVEVYGTLGSRLVYEREREGGDSARAAEELARLGRRAIKPLLEALADDDPAQQAIAVDLLGFVGNEHAAAPLMVFALGSANVELRARALEAIGLLGDASLADRLATMAQRPEQRLRSAAAWALARSASRHAVPALRGLLGHGDPAVRGFAALGLGRIGDRRSAELLLEHLRTDRHAGSRASAAWALGRLGRIEDVEALLAASRDGDPLVVEAAIGSLARVGRGRADVDRAVASAIFDPSPDVRRAALAVAVSGPPDAAWPDPDGRFAVEAYLVRLLARERESAPTRAPDARIVAAIETTAADAFAGPKERVLAALDVMIEGFGPIGDDVVARLVPSMVALASHPEAEIRRRALLTLGRIGGPRAAEALARALVDPDEEVTRVAIEALRPEHGLPEEGLRRLGELAEGSPRWALRLAAVAALGRLADDPSALLRVLASDEYAFVREASARALGRFDSPSVRVALEGAAARDAEPRVRGAAAAALRD